MKWLPISLNYQVSECGLVMNTRTGKILKPFNDWRGYHKVDVDGKQYKLHRLVASRFLPSPTEEKLVVDHIDHDRLNNNAYNLRWVTTKENNKRYILASLLENLTTG